MHGDQTTADKTQRLTGTQFANVGGKRYNDYKYLLNTRVISEPQYVQALFNTPAYWTVVFST